MPGAADLLLNSALVSALGWTLVHFLWQGCVIAFVFWLICVFSPRHAFSLRYWAGLSGMLLSLLVLVVTFLLSYAPDVQFALGPAAATPVNPFLVLSGSLPGAWGLLESGLEPALPWVVLLWFTGVLYFSTQTLRDWIGVRKLLYEGTEETEVQLQLALESLKQQLGVQLAVRLMASTRVAVPMAVGWLRPVILMPVSVLSRLPQDQLEMILAHELGHIRRFDYLFNVLQVILETLLFYHPAISWMSRRVREEREQRCDDLVVRTCGRPTTYARALTNLEVIRSPALAPAVSATGGNLLMRIKLIIDDELPGKDSVLAQFVLAAIAGAAVAFGAQQGYSLSVELNKVAYSAQLQVSDVQWKTWNRSREAWGKGVMNYAQAAKRDKLAELRDATSSIKHLVEPEFELQPVRSQDLPVDQWAMDQAVPIAEVEIEPMLLTGSLQGLADSGPGLMPLVVEISTSNFGLASGDHVLPPFDTGAVPADQALPGEEDETRQVLAAAELTAIKSRMPNYPWRARRQGIEGFVELEFSVDEQGRVTDVEVLDAMPQGVFEKAASKALAKWTFENPEDGDSRFRQIFDFELQSVAKTPPSQRPCIQTGSRTCGQIGPGVFVVWVNSSGRNSGGIGLN